MPLTKATFALTLVVMASGCARGGPTLKYLGESELIGKFQLENRSFHWLKFTGIRKPDGSLVLHGMESTLQCQDAQHLTLWHPTHGAYLSQAAEKFTIPPFGKRTISTAFYGVMRPGARQDQCRFVVTPVGWAESIVSPTFAIEATE